MRYRVARLGNGWTVVTSVPANTAMTTITRNNGLFEYSIFTEYGSGEAFPSPHFFISK